MVGNHYACAAHLFWGYWAIIQVPYGCMGIQVLLRIHSFNANAPYLKKKHASPPKPNAQAKYSPIDFDFLLYASQRLDGYRAFKAKFF